MDKRVHQLRQERNGYLLEHSIQTDVGEFDIKVSKLRDRSGSAIHFTSALLPPYLKCISTGDYQEALAALFGDNAKDLSENTISRLKERWIDKHREC